MTGSLPRIFRVFLLGCLCLAVSSAFAQYRASIQGTVTDSSGAVVKGAKISVKDQDSGRVIETVSNDNGFYSVTGLAPGSYTVTVSMAAFKNSVTNNLDVAAESTKGLNVTLAAGGNTEQVVVNGEAAPAIQTEDANLTGTISAKQVAALPQFRGDPFELVRIAPGVFGLGARQSDGSAANLPNYSGTGGSIFGIYQTENAVQVTANGQRPDANGFTLDGVSTNSQRHGGATVVTPNMESVQEVKVEVNSYNAENGHNAGVIVETVSKSGTNVPHGSFGFREHSPSLNAYQRWGGPNSCGDNLTSCQQRDDLFIRNYFGSIGGAIWKNKVFAFFSFDHQRTYGSYRAQSWVETPEFISSLTDGSIAAQLFAIKGSGFISPKLIPGNCGDVGLTEGEDCQQISDGTLDIGSRSGNPGDIVGSLGGGLDGIADVQHLDYEGKPDITNATQYNGRLDFQATKNDLIAFSVYRSPLLKTFLPGGWVDGREYNTFNSDTQHNAATALWTRTINATMVNEARFNVTHWYFDELKGNPQAPWGLPSGNITAGNQGIGVGFFSTPGIFHEATYAFRDNLTKVYKSHVMKFGFAMDREQNNDKSAWAAHPTYNFDNLWSFANDAPTSQGTGTFDPKTGAITAFPKYVRVSDYAIFAQDNWKLRPNLTLTLGLRWEYFTPLHDTQNSLSHIILGQGANALTDLKVVQGGSLSNPDRNNFGPQFGFAWSPGRFNNRMVWRGGIGVAYNKIGESRILQADGNPPSFVALGLDSTELVYGVSSGGPYSFDGYPVNPHAILTFNENGLPVGGEHLAKPDIRGPLMNMRTPYTFHYSLETQYDLGHNWTTSLSYQGSQSRKMQRTVNYDIFTQTDPQILLPNPLVNSIFLTQSDANAGYNALLARISHQFSHGVQLDANYRWSKSIDFCSYDENCGDQQSYPIDQRFERGPSDFDVTHSFTANVLYELPFFRHGNGILHTVAGGWQISSIISLNSGFPWSPVFSYNGATCDRLTLAGISCTARPGSYLGGGGNDYSTSTFQKQGGNFPNGGLAYFDPLPPGVNIPGVGRNSFRGPRYTGIDMGFGKRFVLPKLPLLGEDAGFEVKATAFNIFNKVNVQPFGYNSDSTRIGSADPDGGVESTPNIRFGQGTGAYSGRVFELTARFSF